jgi:diketogulonate reductase-like aldo/keto reductase
MDHVTVQGVDVPALGLGTWRLTGEQCYATVSAALQFGYRHIDTAQAYGNERRVGDAIADSAVDRDDLFLVTKLDWDNRRYEDVLRSTEESLARLGTDYVDLLLIHSPRPGVPVAETLDAMNELVAAGKVEHVGVSNFGVERLHEARELSDAPIFADQVQFSPYWTQTELVDYCTIHDVLVTAYSPLAHGKLVDDPALEDVGRRYGKSAAQVALRWLVQQEGVCTIPKATSHEHLEANLEVFDFELTDEEMQRVRRPNRPKALWGMVRGQLPL